MRIDTALVELLKESRDLRVFFKGCCSTSALRLHSQAYRYRDELAERGVQANLRDVQDTLYKLARNLFPESPGADFVTWVGLLCGDAIARIGEHYANLSLEEKEAADISGAWEHNAEVVAACEAENIGAFKEALMAYEREALAALEAARERSGAA